MKLLFVSDIHGSGYYIKKFEEIIKQEKPDKIIILGDILYHGPRNPLTREYNPKIVIEVLNRYSDKIIAVRGNCDSEVDQMVLNFDIMQDYKVLEHNNRNIWLSHGHVYNIEKLPPLKDGDIFIQGHLHIHNYQKHNNIFYFNPGSLSYPKENTTNSYGLIENNTFYIKDLDKNIIHECELC